MTHEQQIDDLERTLWTVLTKLSHRRIGDAIAKASGYNLPPASWTLLEFLSRSGPIRVSEIAAYNGIETSSVTPRLKALEAGGFIERGAEPGDGRVSLISIGKIGRKAVNRMRAARKGIYSAVLVDTATQDIRKTCSILKQLAEGLEARIE